MRKSIHLKNLEFEEETMIVKPLFLCSHCGEEMTKDQERTRCKSTPTGNHYFVWVV